MILVLKWYRIFELEYLKSSMRDAQYEFTIRQCVTMAETYIHRSEDEFYTLDEMKEYV